MTILVADNTPPAVRGLLKRWFIEPRPNVFVGTINHRVRSKVVEYVRRVTPELALLIVASDNSAQGFSVESYGDTSRKPVVYCGLHLIAEKWDEKESEPCC